MFATIKGLFSRPTGRTAEKPRPAPAAAPSVLDTTPRIRERFPGVRHLAINLSIRAPFQEMEPTLNNRSLGPDAVAYFLFRCKNVDCQGGGFDMTEALEQGIAAKKASVSGRQVCQGWRSKQLTNQQRCHFELNYTANISYD